MSLAPPTIVVLLVLLRRCASDDCERPNRLTLGVLVPDMAQHSIRESVEAAVRDVHATSGLLPDYCLDLLYKETQASVAAPRRLA